MDKFTYQHPLFKTAMPALSQPPKIHSPQKVLSALLYAVFIPSHVLLLLLHFFF